MTASVLLGLDVGSVRIGVASARTDVRIAHPLTTLEQGPAIFDEIELLARQHDAELLVVGWPRGMDGQETAQTRSVEAFAERLRLHSGRVVTLQDEALTSHKAESELKQRKRPYDKAEVDALAAAFILDDYLRTQEETAHV